MDVDATDDVLVKNYGEFSLTLNKINGSLGFSLRSDPEDTTALRWMKINYELHLKMLWYLKELFFKFLILYFRHSVKALVKEPAISDGRIRPGDKLISANGQVILITKCNCIGLIRIEQSIFSLDLLLSSSLIFSFLIFVSSVKFIYVLIQISFMRK